jgi:hypothetical protein
MQYCHQSSSFTPPDDKFNRMLLARHAMLPMLCLFVFYTAAPRFLLPRLLPRMLPLPMSSRLLSFCC